MSFADFLDSTATAAAPPPGLGPPLQALWHAARGEWDTAHRLVQERDGADSAWVHAHLHREEGDEANAGYWYRRAGQPVAQGDRRVEWEQIVRGLLGRGD